MSGSYLPSGYFSVQEAADKVGLSAETLRRWDKAGLLKPERIPVGNRFHRAYTAENILYIQALKATEIEKRAYQHLAKAQELFAESREFPKLCRMVVKQPDVWRNSKNGKIDTATMVVEYTFENK